MSQLSINRAFRDGFGLLNSLLDLRTSQSDIYSSKAILKVLLARIGINTRG